MNCTNCGASNGEGSVFCQNCGSRLDLQTSASADNNNSQGYYQPGAQDNGQQSGYQQPVYAPQPQQAYTAAANPQDAPMTLGDQMLTLLLTWIPLVGFIMLLVWGFSSNTNTNKKNYARAMLIYQLIGLVLSILFIAVLVPVLVNVFEELADSLYYY